ncbi:N-acetylmuramoyl-L-alanine amidase family protein [Hazenella coriacea]|uniref:N-acetylmuramoyl-L-alanine amidase n=1 Tax=Hazenella coriacea TaxID=1179467 RepID=A0A4R3L0R8_9BACL|nr:N-acetylmuramoyl-L-alanine amidase [Hazenella coriacea]TCS93133.1 N-acetylmuramoyl-L-alanine amidase [Hazenella coriacea]
MSYLIALDDGHGLFPTPTPGKRTPMVPEINRRIYENEFNREVVKYLHQELIRCGFRTLLVAPTDEDVPLSTRTRLANQKGAHLYVSVHYNAGGGSGVETYHFPGSVQGAKAARTIHKYVIQGTKQRDRGVKTANFHVLRETKMPSVLIEYGFMDDPSLHEARLMLNVAFQQECARETAQGICEYFGIAYKPPVNQKTKPFYDVVVNGADRASLSARNIKELSAYLVKKLNEGVDSITFNKRK